MSGGTKDSCSWWWKSGSSVLPGEGITIPLRMVAQPRNDLGLQGANAEERSPPTEHAESSRWQTAGLWEQSTGVSDWKCASWRSEWHEADKGPGSWQSRAWDQQSAEHLSWRGARQASESRRVLLAMADLLHESRRPTKWIECGADDMGGSATPMGHHDEWQASYRGDWRIDGGWQEAGHVDRQECGSRTGRSPGDRAAALLKPKPGEPQGTGRREEEWHDQHAGELQLRRDAVPWAPETGRNCAHVQATHVAQVDFEQAASEQAALQLAFKQQLEQLDLQEQWIAKRRCQLEEAQRQTTWLQECMSLNQCEKPLVPQVQAPEQPAAGARRSAGDEKPAAGAKMHAGEAQTQPMMRAREQAQEWPTQRASRAHKRRERRRAASASGHDEDWSWWQSWRQPARDQAYKPNDADE